MLSLFQRVKNRFLAVKFSGNLDPKTMLKNSNNRPTGSLGIAVLTLALSGTSAQAIPIGDAFSLDDGSRKPVYDSHSYHPGNDSSQPLLNELNPTLTPEVNTDHPYPEYLNKFMQGDQYPKYYEQLLKVEPDDQVQSKVFDPEAFRGVRRIGVIEFENKTRGLEKDEEAGSIVAERVSTELDTVGRYAVIHPKKMVEEYQMKIMTTPESRKNSTASRAGQAPQSKTARSASERNMVVYDLPYSADKIDAVMIGAVTRYGHLFYDQQGNPSKSPAVALEFGVYLISTQTGEAIWGARFVGSQRPSITNLRFGKLRWLNKREFTQMVVSRVLKDFTEARAVTPGQ